jgi:thiamine transport system permease protein
MDPRGAEVAAIAPPAARRTPGVSALWLGLAPLAFLALLLLAPLLRLLAEAGALPLHTLWADVWQDDYLRWRVLWSFLQAAITCVLALLLGLPVAWVLARFHFTGRGLVLRLLMLPFVVPTLVAALGVLALAGPRGLLGRAFGADLQGTPWLLLYGNLFFNLCLVVRAGADALAQVSATRIAAARSLGATPWRVFWRIEWPAIAPALMSALCLVFLYCFAGFGLALVLGGQRYATVEVEIYTLVAYELKLAEAGALATGVLLLTGTVAVVYAFIEKRLAAPARAPGLALLGLVGVAPLAAILWRAFAAGPAAWAVLLEADTLAALWNTLRFSAMAVLLATLLGLLHALAARRSALLRAAAFLPFVVSPVMVAFGLLLLYPQWTASLPLLVAAYALLAFPFVAQALGATLDNLPALWAQAARTLGASRWRVFWRVTLPLVGPALRRGMAFAAATAVGEFAVTLFLSRPEWTTLSTLIYQHLGRPGAANLDAAMVLASLLMALALLVFLAIDWPQRSSRHA